jgi:hypothetical protein
VKTSNERLKPAACVAVRSLDFVIDNFSRFSERLGGG